MSSWKEVSRRPSRHQRLSRGRTPILATRVLCRPGLIGKEERAALVITTANHIVFNLCPVLFSVLYMYYLILTTVLWGMLVKAAARNRRHAEMEFWREFKEGTICRCVGRFKGINQEYGGSRETSHRRKLFLLLGQNGRWENGVVRAWWRAIRGRAALRGRWQSWRDEARAPVVWGWGKQGEWTSWGLMRCWGN